MRGRLGSRRGLGKELNRPQPFLGVPGLDVRVLAEPKLLFGDLQKIVDPRVGLGLYGPFDIDDPGRRTAIRLGLIGTSESVELVHQLVARSRSSIAPVRRTLWQGNVTEYPMDPAIYPFFPGLERAFDIEVVLDTALVETLGRREVAELERIKLYEPRVTRLVDMVMERLRVLAEKPASPDVCIVALSGEVRALCTGITRHARRRQPRPDSVVTSVKLDLERDKRGGQRNLFGFNETFPVSEDQLAEEADGSAEHSVFHDGLKARAMKHGIPTQLIWESTLRGLNVEDDATRAWNFWTGIYYKAGNVPWRAHTVARGTCFVGVAFYVDRSDRSLRSAMAQAFSDHGEGIVLRGERFEWEGPRHKSPHLPRQLAADLMRQVLAEYERHLHHRPARVVLHKWSRYWEEERAGFDDGLADIRTVDYVALGSRGIQFFRAGEHPPLRGTMITMDRGNAILYTRGFVPFLGAHLGPRIPRPIEITEHIGPTSMTQICTELLILTKLDWNTTSFAGKEPITTAFSEKVGKILAEIPPGTSPRTLYRFYM